LAVHSPPEFLDLVSDRIHLGVEGASYAMVGSLHPGMFLRWGGAGGANGASLIAVVGNP
jgi:hypothetical protein